MQKEYTEEQAIKEAIEYNSVHTKGETEILKGELVWVTNKQ